MTTEDIRLARAAISALPKATSDGECPDPVHVYSPPSHLKAIDPNVSVVIGMHGAGKTFWWGALQNQLVRRQIQQRASWSALTEQTEVHTGFGVNTSDNYPNEETLRSLISYNIVPKTIWRTVLAWRVDKHCFRFSRKDNWFDRVAFVRDNSENIDRCLRQRDVQLDRMGVHLLLLFDGLDRCADDRQATLRMIRGLLQVARDLRSYRRLRVKVFLRTDQIDLGKIADFPDATKVLATRVELSWPRPELYGLLWHCLANGQRGDDLRPLFVDGEWPAETVGDQTVFVPPRQLISDEEHQRERFHRLSGPWISPKTRRGSPYSWIPIHLSDVDGRVSARSFLTALRTAADETATDHPDHDYALHYRSIKTGVRQASQTRIDELLEDHPWVDTVLTPLRGMTVPCTFGDVETRWQRERVIDRLADETETSDLKLPPHINRGAEGVRQDLEELHVFQRLFDGRVNIPDVFRVGYGLGRKGGVKPVR